MSIADALWAVLMLSCWLDPEVIPDHLSSNTGTSNMAKGTGTHLLDTRRRIGTGGIDAIVY